MIRNCETWGYLAVAKLFYIFREISSNHNGYFYCLDCLYSFRTKVKHSKHGKFCKYYKFVKFYRLLKKIVFL